MESNNIQYNPEEALEKDKNEVKMLFGEAALTEFEYSVNKVPEGYFDTFPGLVLGQVKKNKAKLFLLQPMGKIAVAASFLLVVAATFLYQPTLLDNHQELMAVELKDLSNEEIDEYLSNNELLADIDFHSEINNMSAEFESIYIK